MLIFEIFFVSVVLALTGVRASYTKRKEKLNICARKKVVDERTRAQMGRNESKINQ